LVFHIRIADLKKELSLGRKICVLEKEGLMRSIALLLAIASILIIIGCETASTTHIKTAASSLHKETRFTSSDLLDAKGNVVLCVSNQSIVAALVDIQVTIDGETVIEDDFDFGNGHNWKQFGLKLKPGCHLLIARSIKGKASIKKSFVVKGKHWIELDYWYNTAEFGMAYPRKFIWIMQEEPLVFM
jgi:hypothetical protein